MTESNFTYDVKCKTCRVVFQVQLFESHQKNLFIVDKKDWYCDPCKKEYFKKQTETLSHSHQKIGLPPLSGTEKQINWAVKIRSEMINKVDYLRKSLTFAGDDEKTLSNRAFGRFFQEWQERTSAKWWIDNRQMTVRDISKQVAEITAEMEAS